MRILIIGGAGFIGSHLVNYFNKNKHEVAVLDNFTYNHVKHNDLTVSKLISGNACILSVTHRVIEAFKPEIIYILANGTYEEGVYSPFKEATVLSQIVTNVIQSISIVGGVKHLFFGSSCEVYSSTRAMVKENSIVGGFSYTGMLYKWAENFIAASAFSLSFNYTFLRYFHIYGNRKRVHPKGDVVGFLNHYTQTETTFAISGPDIRVDCLYIDDAVSATVAVFNFVQKRNEVFAVNIGSGSGIKQLKLYKQILKQNNKKYNATKVVLMPASPQLHSRIADISLLSSIGWKQKITLKKGINLLIEKRV